MVAKKLSQEEENRLYSISVVPAVVVFAIIASYYSFVHLAEIPSTASLMLDLLRNFFLPLMVVMPASFFITYEILTAKTESSVELHAKRFLGRMATVLIGGLVFVLVYLASYFFLAPVISERFAMLSSLLIWLVILTAGVTKFKGLFDKLEKGQW